MPLVHLYRLKAVSEDGCAVLEADGDPAMSAGPREITVRGLLFLVDLEENRIFAMRGQVDDIKA